LYIKTYVCQDKLLTVLEYGRTKTEIPGLERMHRTRPAHDTSSLTRRALREPGYT